MITIYAIIAVLFAVLSFLSRGTNGFYFYMLFSILTLILGELMEIRDKMGKGE